MWWQLSDWLTHCSCLLPAFYSLPGLGESFITHCLRQVARLAVAFVQGYLLSWFVILSAFGVVLTFPFLSMNAFDECRACHLSQTYVCLFIVFKCLERVLFCCIYFAITASLFLIDASLLSRVLYIRCFVSSHLFFVVAKASKGWRFAFKLLQSNRPLAVRLWITFNSGF